MLTVTATAIDFQGIKQRVKYQDLSDDALTTLAAGETFEDEFDIASTSDLSEGGALTLSSSGWVLSAKDSSVDGYIPFTSNEITIDVDAAEAAPGAQRHSGP